MTNSDSQQVAGSFRDPSGFLFTRDGQLYRQINQAYSANYLHLMSSGLYQALVEEGLLIPHAEVDIEAARDGGRETHAHTAHQGRAGLVQGCAPERGRVTVRQPDLFGLPREGLYPCSGRGVRPTVREY